MRKDNVIDLEDYKYFNSPEYKSDDLLEEALECESPSKALKLAKKALEIYPDNIDAEAFIAQSEESPIKRLKKFDAILEKATKLLEEKNMFDKENIGIFWGLLETRPYMRVRYNRILILKELGRYKEVIKECEELLTLCENDNMGVRYILVGAYCILEKFEECEKLCKKYYDGSTYMSFPMAIMYFKKGDYRKAKQYLKKTDEQNEFLLDFILEQNDEFLYEDDPQYYSHGSEEEAFLVLRDFLYLLGIVPMFVAFIQNEYRKN